MPEWTRNLVLGEPAALAPLLDGITTLNTAANATLDAAGDALDAASLFLTGVAAPQAAAAEALIADAQAILNDTFGSGLFRLVVHPWQPGVGRGEGVWRNLDFPRAVETVAASFDDLGDTERPQFSTLADVEMIVLVAGGPSPSILKSTVEGLLALIASSELKLALRRIEQAFAQDAEHFTLPQGSVLPDWESVTVREVFPALAPLEDALKSQLATLAGYAAGASDSIGIATELIEAKRQQLTTLQNRLNAASALFSQGIEDADVWTLHVEGTGGNTLLKNALATATGGPGPELSFCVATAWVGGAGSLLALREILGL